jgi:HemY protein
MAAIERGEGSPDNVVRGWLTEALGASRGPQWMCTSCNHIHGNWVPVCENCQRFDTLAWAVPPKASEPANRSTDMLPLIVGALEDKSDKFADAAEPEAPAAVIKETTTADTSAEAPHTPRAKSRKPGLAEQVEDISDDMDGILGDPHTVPEILDAKT